MYTTLMKEIILDIDYDTDKAKKQFIQFCRTHFLEDDVELEKLNQFEQSYEPNTTIWWYTKECFLFSALNRALRLHKMSNFSQRSDFLLKISHRQIEKCHSETHQQSKLTLYRGQGLSNLDFEKLQKSTDGLFFI